MTDNWTPPPHTGPKLAVVPSPIRKASTASPMSAPYLTTVVRLTMTAAMLTPK
jgi:hypothetical protein